MARSRLATRHGRESSRASSSKVWCVEGSLLNQQRTVCRTCTLRWTAAPCPVRSRVIESMKRKSTHHATAGVPGSLVGKRHPFCCGQSGASCWRSIRGEPGDSCLNDRHSERRRGERLRTHEPGSRPRRGATECSLFAAPCAGTVHRMR